MVETTVTPQPDGMADVDPTMTCGIESGTPVAPGAGYTSTVCETPGGEPHGPGVLFTVEVLQAASAAIAAIPNQTTLFFITPDHFPGGARASRRTHDILIAYGLNGSKCISVRCSQERRLGAGLGVGTFTRGGASTGAAVGCGSGVASL